MTDEKEEKRVDDEEEGERGERCRKSVERTSQELGAKPEEDTRWLEVSQPVVSAQPEARKGRGID